MSTPTSNTAVVSSGLSIGLLIGGIILAAIVVGVFVYVIKKRRGGANLSAAPSGPPTAANGLGAMNQGSNAVTKTTMNMNAGRMTS
jgi:hypothetical protein